MITHNNSGIHTRLKWIFTIFFISPTHSSQNQNFSLIKPVVKLVTMGSILEWINTCTTWWWKIGNFKLNPSVFLQICKVNLAHACLKLFVLLWNASLTLGEFFSQYPWTGKVYMAVLSNWFTWTSLNCTLCSRDTGNGSGFSENNKRKINF